MGKDLGEQMKLIKFKQITGTIRVVTGLHIGGGDANMEISGMDNPIIRNKANNEPYIPGSSLKGKLRSLMEWEENKLEVSGNVHKCTSDESAKNCPICRVFGISADDKFAIGPTRLVIRDAHLSQRSKDRFQDGVPLVEEKSENTINRITAMANPRPIERVVPGTEFDLDISFKILDLDNDNGEKDMKNFNEVLLKALALLQEDYLGGGGSRGNGKIRFENLKDENEQPLTLPKI
jgi:CRISPR-associated protein Csm3